MIAIYKREMRSYFTSPIGYIFVAIFMAVSAWFFMSYTLQQGEASSPGSYFQIILVLFVAIIPLLTMKLMSEERKLRTEQLILTGPVTLPGIVIAKYLAAYTVFGGSFAVSSVIYYIPLSLYGEPNAVIYFCCALAVLLAGGAFIAIGVFASALTENQFIAAFSTMAMLIPFVFASSLNSYINNELIRRAISALSVTSRYVSFASGVLDWPALIYYVSLSGLFLFLTVRVLERRRWA
ncbi:MAG: ABC transporter [Ruminococcaceae bacterium]|nr:ABC transporter [Oscillospiraceae bacterium]